MLLSSIDVGDFIVPRKEIGKIVCAFMKLGREGECIIGLKINAKISLN
jgi:hypothetical protein